MAHDATPLNRREANRVRRRKEYLDTAAHLITTQGLDGLTMQAIAKEVGAAVGTIYTYFPSKSDLVSELQVIAIGVLTDAFDQAVANLDEHLEAEGLAQTDAILTRLCAFGAYFMDVSETYPEEFHLQQMLISERREIVTIEDVQKVIPAAFELLDRPRKLLDEAVGHGVLGPGSALERVIVWAAALNGVSLLDNVTRIDPALFDTRRLVRGLTDDLLRAWGAPGAAVAAAEQRVDRLIETGPFIPLVPRWVDRTQ